MDASILLLSKEVSHRFQERVEPVTIPFLRMDRGRLTSHGSRAQDEISRRGEVAGGVRSEEHTSELQSPCNLVCRLLLEKKKINVTALPTLDNRTDTD